MNNDEEARNAYCLNRAVEKYGPSGLVSRQAQIGAARLLARLDMIEPEQFNMADYLSVKGGGLVFHSCLMSTVDEKVTGDHLCGTAACLAGWTAVEQLAFSPDYTTNFVEDAAKDFLGLNRVEAHALFTPYGFATNEGYTLKRGKAVMIHFWRTGHIAWHLALKDELPYE
jgi:hypothetical protein